MEQHYESKRLQVIKRFKSKRQMYESWIGLKKLGKYEKCVVPDA